MFLWLQEHEVPHVEHFLLPTDAHNVKKRSY